MDLLNFYLDVDGISANQERLALTMAQQLSNADPLLFDRFDGDFSSAFLEPTLFHYFLSNADRKLSLRQSLWGYLTPDTRFPVEVSSDECGLINLPGLGYLRAARMSTAELQLDSSGNLLLDGQYGSVTHNNLIEGSSIRFCIHNTYLLTERKIDQERGKLEGIWQRYGSCVDAAFRHLKEIVPEFLKILCFVTRELVVFDSLLVNSMARFGAHV